MSTGTTTILGVGIIGLSTAYYLAQHQPPNTIHLVDPSPELFASASGHAGGFLARDWFGPDVAPLGALSFDEHRRLADAWGGAEKWGYRRSTALSYEVGTGGKGKGKGRGGAGGGGARGEDWLRTGESRATSAAEGGSAEEKEEEGKKEDRVPPWLRREDGDSVSVIGDEDTAAQVDPLRLCRFLLDECLRQGVHLHHPARAVAVMTDIRDELSSVRIQDTTADSSMETDLPCTRLIIAAGAWSARVFTELFPQSTTKLPVSSLAGHSLVMRSSRWTETADTREKENKKTGSGYYHAVFTTSEAGFSPEIFSRAGGEIWIGGLNSSTLPLPTLATEREIRADAISELRQTAGQLLGDGDLEFVREALCFRPVTPYGIPIISRIDDGQLGGGITTRAGTEGGVFLATGHGPWGISLSLGTGVVLAEIIQGRHVSADVSSLVIQ